MKENILVFGGGSLQLSLIKKVKSMDYCAIVIDPDEKCPGKLIADNFYCVEGNDYETTKSIAISHNIKGLVTAATDKPILMMCRIAEELVLPFPSYKSCETLLDKSKFKQFLEINNLPHAKGKMYEGNFSVDKLDISYPVISKPVINSGSRGVIKSNNSVELINAIKETLQHSGNGRFLIEEYIDGDEISVEALVQKGEVYIIQLTDKIVTPPPYNVEIGHIQPSKYSYLKQKIKDLLQTVIDKTGLDNCALHPELKIKDDKITIIEIGPRLGGDFITSDLVPLSTDVDIEIQALLISTGKHLNYSITEKAAMISFLNFKEGLLLQNMVNEVEMKYNFPQIISFDFNLVIGMKVPKITNSLDRYGYCITTYEDVTILTLLQEKIKNYITSKIINHVQK